jgi:hypothetical protein
VVRPTTLPCSDAFTSSKPALRHNVLDPLLDTRVLTRLGHRLQPGCLSQPYPFPALSVIAAAFLDQAFGDRYGFVEPQLPADVLGSVSGHARTGERAPDSAERLIGTIYKVTLLDRVRARRARHMPSGQRPKQP